jgi:predicted TIM-barrel fold metal-dependent hydrolase
MTGWIDAHHHLWDLNAVHYPWLMARGAKRFFGDPTLIQRDYLLEEFRAEAEPHGFTGSVHIQVGAEDGLAEAQWVQSVADAHPDWPMMQVVECDLTAPDLGDKLDAFQRLSSVRGVRQIVGRAPEEDAATGTNQLLANPAFAVGLQNLGRRGLSFDLQLIPELMASAARVISMAPDTQIAVCHAGSPYDRSQEGLGAWSDYLRHLSDLPNVHCKLSGLGMFDQNWTTESIRPIVETCLDQFGTDRLFFGSNFPVDKLRSTYRGICNAFQTILPETHHDAVFGRNASKFYRFY